MDWDKYINLIDALDLKCYDLRDIEISIDINGDNSESVKISPRSLGKAGYLTNNFYTNIIKISNYTEQNLNPRLGDGTLSIRLIGNQVNYVYTFNNTTLPRGLSIQHEFENKKILNLDTKVLLKSELTTKVILIIVVSYIDEDLEIKVI